MKQLVKLFEVQTPQIIKICTHVLLDLCMSMAMFGSIRGNAGLQSTIWH